MNPTRPTRHSLMEQSGSSEIRLDPRAMTSPAATVKRFVLCDPRSTTSAPTQQALAHGGRRGVQVAVRRHPEDGSARIPRSVWGCLASGM